ncbi:MAG: hypothetical protein AAF740_05465 [Bacteroidota bacterium]
MSIKKIILGASLFLLLSATLPSFNSLDRQEHLARVQQIEGIPIYLLSDPVREYEIVDVVQGKRQTYSVQQTLLKIVQKIKKLEEKEKIEKYDALLVAPNLEEVSLIRYVR